MKLTRKQILIIGILMVAVIVGICILFVVNKAENKGVISASDNNYKNIYNEMTEKFTEDCILVVIKKEYSEINKIHEIAKFKHSNIESIEDLTMITGDIYNKPMLNYQEFRQILKINLKKEGVSEVINAIEAISKLDFVESAEPNFIISLDD